MNKVQKKPTPRSSKIYIEVNVDYKTDGSIIPRSFSLDDGETYSIDKVLDIRPAASLKAGGAGIRYKVRIAKHEFFMFLEDDHGVDRWFMERS